MGEDYSPGCCWFFFADFHLACVWESESDFFFIIIVPASPPCYHSKCNDGKFYQGLN